MMQELSGKGDGTAVEKFKSLKGFLGRAYLLSWDRFQAPLHQLAVDDRPDLCIACSMSTEDQKGRGSRHSVTCRRPLH